MAKKMKAKSKQSGLTLTEMTVVVASIALLAVIGLPAVRAFVHSFETEGGTKRMIGAALSSARAMAAEKHRYVGIRFQKAYNRNAADPLDPLTAPQYMIFVVHDPASEPNGTGLANGFRAIEGLKPIKLPDSVGVMDLRYRPDLVAPPGDDRVDTDSEISNPNIFRDTTTFSIVFSPSGKLVTHEVRIRNKNGRVNDSSNDDVFNTAFNVESKKIAMFHQDDYPAMGLWQEYSRNNFIIYDTKEFTQAYKRGQAWSDYLVNVAPKAIYINPYTGTIISSD